MMLIAAILATLMGVSLGLLGGGGSILAVPILIYVLGMGPKEAIATSLLVVGSTSVVCAIQHHRAGNVRWKIGLVFGAVAMIGAYGGGLAAVLFSGETLLLLFVAMMVAAGVAMLKPRPALEPKKELSLLKAGLEGLIVGAVTGLVGAGGGFLVVPALVLFGGVDMRSAVGTSTMVIALKAFAAYAGHSAHVAVDLEIAGWVTGFAVAGSLLGTSLMTRIQPARLRRAFGGFVMLMAVFIVAQQSW